MWGQANVPRMEGQSDFLVLGKERFSGGGWFVLFIEAPFSLKEKGEALFAGASIFPLPGTGCNGGAYFCCLWMGGRSGNMIEESEL